MERLVDLLFSLDTPIALTMIFAILLACGLGLPIPEDISLASAALLAYYRDLNLIAISAFCFLGVLIGDSFMYYLGFHYGRGLLKKKLFSSLVSEEQVETVAQKLNQKGRKMLFAARFMPGFRAPFFFTAGTVKIPYRTFLFYDGTAALISVPTIIFVVHHFGEDFEFALKQIKKAQYSILIILGLLITYAVFKWYRSHKKGSTSN